MLNSSKGSGEPQTRTDDPAQRGGINDNLTAQNSAVNTSGTQCDRNVTTDRNDAVGSNYPVRPEFIKFTRQLRDMNKWFSQYPENDCNVTHINAVCDGLREVAFQLSCLAGYEFLSSCFYDETLKPCSHE